MCEIDDDNLIQAWSDKWRVARKEHKCDACGETIRPGDQHRYSSGIADHTPFNYRHCARCWSVVEKLMKAEGSCEVLLNCGKVYEGDDPAMYELAFMTPDEMQARLRESGDGQSTA